MYGTDPAYAPTRLLQPSGLLSSKVVPALPPYALAMHCTYAGTLFSTDPTCAGTVLEQQAESATLLWLPPTLPPTGASYGPTTLYRIDLRVLGEETWTSQ
eukprot:1193034-Rhodomonas_salina.1